jgi:hypothetical protein
VVGERQQLPTERLEPRLSQHGSGHVEDRCGGHVVVLRGDEATGSQEPALLRLLPDRVKEPRLPDPRLTRDEKELASPGLDVVEAAVGQIEQLIATDEQWTTGGSGHRIHAPGV